MGHVGRFLRIPEWDGIFMAGVGHSWSRWCLRHSMREKCGTDGSEGGRGNSSPGQTEL